MKKLSQFHLYLKEKCPSLSFARLQFVRLTTSQQPWLKVAYVDIALAMPSATCILVGIFSSRILCINTIDLCVNGLNIPSQRE